ncbi:MAG: hypothetical protein AB7O74_00020 [Candidatus Nanopelagicales bacterium]
MSDQVPPPPGYLPEPAPQGLPRTSSNAVVAVVLAICSFLICPVVPAVVALFLASAASREIAASGGWVTGDGLVKGARIASWINIGLWLAIGLFIAVVAIAGSTSSVTSG